MLEKNLKKLKKSKTLSYLQNIVDWLNKNNYKYITCNSPKFHFESQNQILKIPDEETRGIIMVYSRALSSTKTNFHYCS